MNFGIVANYAFPSVGYAINAARSGKMSLPVSPSLLIYSHFKHVSGTPAPEGTRGVHISRLKILDTMIEQLSKMKRQSLAEAAGPLVMDGSEERRINVLIEQYQKQIKSIHAASMASNYALAAPASGALFSISA
ncbi:MAG: hypothetical protein LBU82_03620 [Treponema sp.]|jgi:hypothetical protein|nr:hypothetical protein [Treponema sp.]